MKLLKDSLYLTKSQWRKLFLAMTVMVVALYVIAMVFSLCGSNYFILNYQNEQMDRIENFTRNNVIMANFLDSVFLTIEFSIVLSFILKKFPKWYYVLPFYIIPIILSIFLPQLYQYNFYTFMPFVFHIVIAFIDQIIENKKSLTKQKFSWKKYGFCLLRLLIASSIVYTLQIIIFVIKNGEFSFENHIISLPTHFVYAIEYDWNYVMNMIYSDYYGSVPNETSVYVKMARKFLEDKDAEYGKALKYYLAMSK